MTVEQVILLTVDALGARHVGHHGYEHDTTPYLDTYADSNLSFENCIAQSSHTRESMFSMFLSAYPFEFGGVGRVPDSQVTLVPVLSEAGVETAGFHSNPYLSRAYDFNRGFDTFDDALPLGRNRLMTTLHRVANHFKTQPYTRGEDLNEKAISWLDRAGERKRQFLWLHYMDPHGPYQPPERYQREYSDEVVDMRRAKRLWRRTVDSPGDLTDAERETLCALYDAEIRYVDECIHEFINALDERGLLENTAIVIAADHGELFGEYELYGHPRYPYHELVHVPLVVLGDDVPSGSIEAPVENTAIAPTVADLLGLDPGTHFVGTSLLDAIDDPPELAVSQASGENENAGIKRIAVRSNGYHYCADYSGDRIVDESVFEVADGVTTRVDPDSIDESVLTRLSTTAKERIGAASENSDREPREAPDSAVEERLEDLGYR